MMIGKSALLLQTTTNTFYHCFGKRFYFASSFGGQTFLERMIFNCLRLAVEMVKSANPINADGV